MSHILYDSLNLSEWYLIRKRLNGVNAIIIRWGFEMLLPWRSDWLTHQKTSYDLKTHLSVWHHELEHAMKSTDAVRQ